MRFTTDGTLKVLPGPKPPPRTLAPNAFPGLRLTGSFTTPFGDALRIFWFGVWGRGLPKTGTKGVELLDYMFKGLGCRERDLTLRFRI